MGRKPSTTMSDLSIEKKYENMKQEYRKTQRKLSEAITLLKTYDGDHAIDLWDENIMPSKEWVAKVYKFTKEK